MVEQNYRYIYGPVYSWRLGNSLGIDPIATKEKVCNFNCIYCQLGKTIHLENERKIFVPTKDLIREVQSVPSYLNIDYLTFSGRGEPTLAKNLGDMIRALKEIKKEKIAVITNSSLMYDKEVRSDLLAADFVLAKLDACSDETFNTIGQAIDGIKFNIIVDGIKDFRSLFRGKMALQIMFIDKNKKFVNKIADIARAIGPDEVELNTPLRPSAVKPLSKEEMDGLKIHFKGLSVISVYDTEDKEFFPFDEKETIKRRGNYKAQREKVTKG